MKKLISLLLCVVMVLSLAACGAKEEEAPKAEAPVAEAPKAEAPAEAPAEEAPAEEPAFELPGDVEFVVCFSAGGGSDLYCRTAANIMGELGLTGKRAVTVNNKPGAGGSVGDAYTYTKKGDGTTIVGYVSAQVTGPMINQTEVTYEDLTPICNLAMDEYTIGVVATAEYQTAEEFIAYAKANPGKITVGGSGSGTEDELCTGLIELYADVDLEYVPYDSSGEVMTAMLGGHIAAGIYNPNEALSQYEAGEVILLAAFGPERISVLPEVPTWGEAGYDKVQFQQFRGIFGPPEMDQAAVDYWCDVFAQVIEHPDWTEGYLANKGLTGKFITGDDYGAFVAAEAEKYEAVLDAIGLLPEA